MAAAIEATKNGAESVLILERNDELGGILPQCIHNGFGSILFKKDLPGPFYAQNFIDETTSLEVEILLNTSVLDITTSLKVYATNSREGYMEFQARAIVLAMGCRERTRSQVRIPGSRPAGVFTAGTVQRLVNIEGLMPGKEFVILGSGDIGMIMARRLTLEGAKVKKVLEIMPHLTGLRRNYVQCLEDFHIPLELSTTIKRVIGEKRVEAIETVKVNESLEAIDGTEEMMPCDTLLLSVGLIPENELSKKAGVEMDPLTGGPIVNEQMATSVEGIFAAGNVVTIYDLADYVSKAGFTAGKNAALYAREKSLQNQAFIKLIPEKDIRLIVPQKIGRDASEFLLELRSSRSIEKKTAIEIVEEGHVIQSFPQNYIRPAEMITLKIKMPEISGKISPQTDFLSIRIRE